MFELGRVDDLLVPTSPSTGRALDSFVRRTTFEALKRAVIDVDAAPEGARSALRALRDSFAARLPGDPHAIAEAIANPGIGSLLRAGLVWVGEDGGDAWLPIGIARLRAAIGDAPAEPVATLVTIEGRIAFRVGDRPLERCLGVTAAAPTDADVRSARAAIAILQRVAPSTRADVDRFAGTILTTSTRAAALPTSAVGIGCVDGCEDAAAVLIALVESVTCGKLSALVGEKSDRAGSMRSFRDGAARAASAVVLRAALAAGVLRTEDVDSERLVIPSPVEPPGSSEGLEGVVDEWRELARRMD